MRSPLQHGLLKPLLVGAATAALSACGGSDSPSLPTLAAATPGTLISCTDLATKAALPNTTIASTALVAAGALAALVMVPLILKEGREAWRGHLCCDHCQP